MPKLRPAKPDEVKRVLEKSGFTCIRRQVDDSSETLRKRPRKRYLEGNT